MVTANKQLVASVEYYGKFDKYLRVHDIVYMRSDIPTSSEESNIKVKIMMPAYRGASACVRIYSTSGGSSIVIGYKIRLPVEVVL